MVKINSKDERHEFYRKHKPLTSNIPAPVYLREEYNRLAHAYRRYEYLFR
jgi:hypothetical protein